MLDRNTLLFVLYKVHNAGPKHTVVCIVQGPEYWTETHCCLYCTRSRMLDRNTLLFVLYKVQNAGPKHTVFVLYKIQNARPKHTVVCIVQGPECWTETHCCLYYTRSRMLDRNTLLFVLYKVQNAGPKHSCLYCTRSRMLDRNTLLFVLYKVQNAGPKQQKTDNTMVKRQTTQWPKDRHHNGQKKKYNRTNNNLQNIHIKLKINDTNSSKIQG